MDAATYTRLEEHLVNVSRSFALGIQAMDSPLRERICHAYLVCRILDTIEDYGEIPAVDRADLLTRAARELFDPAARKPLLADIRAAFDGVPVTEGERGLLDDMDLVFDEYDAFAPAVRARMEPNLREMALGMARFVATEPDRGIDGFDALGNLVHYCHFVAGVVGTLLTDQFVLAIGPDDVPIGLQGELHSYADSFGIGLQLVNVLKNVGDDARRHTSFIPRVLLDRAGARLRELIDAPQSGPSRRFVLDLTSIASAFLQRAIAYTNLVPLQARGGRGVRHFLALPLVFALRTLRLGVAHPAFAFHEQKLKISRDDVRQVQSEVVAALDDADALAQLLQRELDALTADLDEALKDAPPARREGDGADASLARFGARDDSRRDLASVINLFLMTFEDPREWRDAAAIAQADARHLPRVAPAASSADDTAAPLARSVGWLRDARTAGHWNGLVEASPALNAQAIFLGRALGIFDESRLQHLADYLRHVQRPDGAWTIFAGGDGHFDTTVFGHLALHCLKDPQDLDRLERSTAWIRERARTHNQVPGFELRFVLALLGLWPWDDIPALSPVVVLPTASQAFSRFDFAYWIRIALVPMTILVDRRYQLQVPGLTPDALRSLGISPGRRTAREQEQFDRWDDLVTRMTERLALQRSDLERIGIAHAERIVLTRQDLDGSWGGIYPGIQYSLLALHALGHSLTGPGSPAARAVDALKQYQAPLPADEGASLIQESCQSPVWDTAWALFALERAGENLREAPWRDAVNWIVDQQILIEGDWAARTRLGFGGGWAFQYANAFYPDVDDSALVLAVLANVLAHETEDEAGDASGNVRDPRSRATVASAARIGLRWLLAMQNEDGGWAAFERGVDNELMREVPMNDLDNWLDPSTADVTGRCLMALGRFGFTADSPIVARAVRFLRTDQAKSGAWWGRWGVNYIYGTWSVLTGLEAIGFDMTDAAVQKAAKWLQRCQNADGGWGETCESYVDPTCAGQGDSTASQTAWAVLGLCAAGMHDSDNVHNGVRWLAERQTDDGTWNEAAFTGTGFPKAFYLRYHLYRHYFPVLALADVAARSAPSDR
ncbi:MAG: squalene--hopene cyclase [Planctomycetota bacterium]